MAETIKTLSQRVSLLEQEIAEIKALLKAQAHKPAPVAAPPAPQAQPAPKPAPAQEEAINPEIMAVISAAVTHFLGLRARIRQARVVPPPSASSWAQQGRVFIQASHNLVHR